MDENTSKTIQEASKATGKVAELLAKVGEFVGNVIGPSVSEFAGMAGDWAAYIRMKNLCMIYDKVQDLQSARSTLGKHTPIPTRLAIPLLQAASNEDNEELQEMWASLIVSATDPENKFKLQKVHIGILAQAEPLDAMLLKRMFINSVSTGSDISISIHLPTTTRMLEVSEDEVRYSLENLLRLGCIAYANVIRPKQIDDAIETAKKYRSSGSEDLVYLLPSQSPPMTYRVTNIGRQLIKACCG